MLKSIIFFVFLFFQLSLFAQDKVFVADSIMDAYMRSGYADKHFIGKGKFDKYDKMTGKWKDYEVNFENVFLIKEDDSPIIRVGMFLIYGKGEYAYGKREGEWKHYALEDKSFKKVHFKTSTYVKGKQEGEAFYYFPNGKIAAKTFYKNNLVDGKFVQYYLNGQESVETTVKDSKRVGEQFTYSTDGNVTSIRNYVNDTLHGKSIFYYNDGKVQWSTEYKMGKVNGSYKYFRENGQLWTEKEYVDDLVMNVKTYSETGEEIENGTLKDGNGTLKHFQKNGKLYLIQTYENGAVVSEERFDDFDWD